MRSRTYAYNGIILGILSGMAAGAYTESAPIGVIVAILGSVVCFLVIRFLENMLGKGIDKATDAVANQFAKPGRPFSSFRAFSANCHASRCFLHKMWRCGKTRQRFLHKMRNRTEKELNTKLGQKRPQQCGLFCCNLGLIRYADIVIITGNLCNGKILNAYNGAEDFSCPQI